MIEKIFATKYRFLSLLLAADAVLVILYALYGFKFLTDPKFGLIEDWSYAEVFQYTKEFWIVLLLLIISIRTGSWRYATWIGVFVYILLDDSCQIHEFAGGQISQLLSIEQWGSFTGQNFGELVFMGSVAGIVGTMVLASLWKADQFYLQTAITLFAMMAVFAFFSVIVDQMFFETYWLVDKAIGAIEDGGEQVVMSCITWYVYHVSISNNIDSSGT